MCVQSKGVRTARAEVSAGGASTCEHSSVSPAGSPHLALSVGPLDALASCRPCTHPRTRTAHACVRACAPCIRVEETIDDFVE